MIYFFWIALTVVVLDQYTKYLILRYVAEHGLSIRDYISSGNNIIDITYATNTGAAFSLFPDQQKLFVIITFLTLAGILIYIYRSKELTRIPITGLAFIFGGALGNLIDRLRFGMVIDFIDLHWKEVYHWPTFNIADSMICVGVGILFVNLFYFERQSSPVISTAESTDQSLHK